MVNAAKRIKLETEEDDDHNSDNQRPSGSCETCKTRKVRCDRARPACDWCKKNNTECVYKTKKKPGLKPGFGKELTSRISTVEEELSKHAKLIESLTQQVEYWRNTAMQPGVNGNSHQSPSVHSNHSNHSMHSIMVNSQHQSQNASPGHGQQQLQPHSQASSTAPPPPALSAPQQDQHLSPQDAQGAQESPVPDASVVKELVTLYFARLHPQFPILHPTKTKQWLASVVDKNFHEPWPMLLYAIVTVTLRCLPGSRLTAKQFKRYYEHCRNKVVLQSLNITTVERLQALVVLAVDMVGVSNGPETWGILALICSAASHLRICKEPTPVLNNDENSSISTKADELLPETTNTIELESRRRLFWGIYVLDRFSAVATSFSFKLNENDIDRMLPVQEALWTSENTSELPKTRWLKVPTRTDYSLNNVQFVDPFGYLIELLQILGTMHSFLKEPVNIHSLTDVIQWQMKYRQMDQQIDDWHKSVPQEYINPTQLFLHSDWCPMKILVYSAYNTAMIRLHSSAGYAFLRSEFFTNSPTAAQKCLQAAKNMTALARQVSSISAWEYMGAHYAWCIWVSARLLLVDCVTTHKSFPNELEFLTHHLKELGKYWGVAQRYWEILNLVIDEELSLRTSKPSSAKTSEKSDKESTTKIFSDMRRNAYALDFLLTNKKDSSSQSNSPAQTTSLNQAVEPENLNGMFDWFNWPKALDGIATPQVHSLDEYKNILSKENFEYDMLDNQQDWLQQ